MNSLTHTSWECKYHIVYAPKYRRWVIYGKMKAEIRKILRELCERKGIEVIAAEYCWIFKRKKFFYYFLIDMRT